MAKVPIPQALSMKISQDAVRFAREEMGGYGWSDRSLQALQPMPGEGIVGIKTSLKYLMHQNQGIQPFLMTWVQGRVIPMRSGGATHFRRGGHVGEPGFVNIPGRGQVWRDQKWRHPGLPGRKFMQSGLQKAITQNKPVIDAWTKRILSGR